MTSRTMKRLILFIWGAYSVGHYIGHERGARPDRYLTIREILTVQQR